MTPQAYKYLLNRVRFRSLPKEPSEPAAIKRLRKALERYEAARWNERSKRNDAMEEARIKAREVIHGGNYDEALKAVKEFERMKF